MNSQEGLAAASSSVRRRMWLPRALDEAIQRQMAEHGGYCLDWSEACRSLLIDGLRYRGVEEVD